MTAACSFSETTEAYLSLLMSLFESSCTIKSVLIKREYHYSLINWPKKGSLLSFIYAAQWKLSFLQKLNSLICLLRHKKKLSLGRNFRPVILNDSSRDILFCTHTYCQQYASWDNQALVKLMSNFFRPQSFSYWAPLAYQFISCTFFCYALRQHFDFTLHMSKPLSSDEVSLSLIFRLIYFFFASLS